MNPDNTDEKDKKPEGDDFQKGLKEGVNQDLDSLKGAFETFRQKLTGPDNDYGNLKGLQDMANKKAQGYDDGGVVSDVDSSELPQPETDWQDKLKTVLAAMTNSPGAKVLGAVTDPVGSALRAGAVAAPTVLQAEAPPIQNLASNLSGGALPPSSPTPAPNIAPTSLSSPPQAPVMPSQPPTAEGAGASASPDAPTTSQRPPAVDILNKLTDGDGAKMSALLASLKDQDKRSAFAQALGVIGDTFGNIGQAKAGQHPDGFQTPDLINKMNETSKKNQIDNLTQSLASDPNSQTSRMAQSTLLQSMGIKPGDPREAKIRAMPALAITQLLPQMTDAVKNNIEKEKTALQSKQMGEENKLKQQELGVSVANSERAQQTANQQGAGATLKDLSPANPANWSVLSKARQTLSNSLGAPHPQDVQAVNWAHTHPNDPRSKAILAANGL
jgi:hypothetical protein